MKACPTVERLAGLVDGALAREDAEDLGLHLVCCARCGEVEHSLRELVADLKSCPPGDANVRAHVAAVLERIDQPIDRALAAPHRRWLFAAVGAAAAAGVVAVGVGAVRLRGGAQSWQARGAAQPPSLSRDVDVRPYAAGERLRLLESGAAIGPQTPLTAGFRNVGQTPAFVLLFAVDSRRSVHWISPPFADAREDPASTPLPVAGSERALDTTAVLEDVPPGPLLIVAVITAKPTHVSEVESLEGSELSAAQLRDRFPGAEVRETIVRVTDSNGGDR